jgi:ribosomal protein L1
MDDLVAADIKAGKMDFTVIAASPDAMRIVGTLVRFGVCGLMPTRRW